MTFGRLSTEAPIASVDRALAVVERLTESGPEGEALGTLAADLGVSKAGLHHTLAALRHRGWVEQTDAGNYVLGAITGQLAQWWTSTESVARLLHPTLLAIAKNSKELVHLGRLSGANVVYLDKVEPDRAIRVWSQVGRTIPAVMTAMGRAILGTSLAPSFSPVEGSPDGASLTSASRRIPEGSTGTREAYLAKSGQTSTAEQIDLDPWMHGVEQDDRGGLAQRVIAELTRVVADGYACEVEENEPGVSCVAVPISVVGNRSMAISITAPTERLNAERAHALAALISHTVNAAGLENVSATSVSLRNLRA